jgi:tRNA1(Val) A37 N6-methylase TrmN6
MQGFPYHRLFLSKQDVERMYDVLKSTDTLSENRIKTNQYKIPGVFLKPWFFGINSYECPRINRLKFDHLTIMSQPEDYIQIDQITNYFTEEARMKARVGMNLSPLEFWNQKQEMIIQGDRSVQEYREEIFKFSQDKTSQMREATLFKSTLAKTIYDIFQPKNILDFSAGWGDRLIAAIAYGKANYTGFDPNLLLVDGHQQMIQQFGGTEHQYNVIPEPFETYDIKKFKQEQFDLVFTSPPYFDFEVYCDDENQSIKRYPDYEVWIKKFLFKSIHQSFELLQNGGYLVIHISDTGSMKHVVQRMIEYIQYDQNKMYVGCIASQTSMNKRPQPLWVFKKKANKRRY